MPGLVVLVDVARPFHSQFFGSNNLGDLRIPRLLLDVPMGWGWSNGNVVPPLN
jgi:hypothetical protein